MSDFDDLDALVEQARQESSQKAKETKDKPKRCSLEDRQFVACEG